MNKSTVRFVPWIGSNYEEGFRGLRILLVCESHYGAKQHERPTVTPEIIKALALGERHPRATGKLRRHKHFTKIMCALQNVRQQFTRTQKREFWNSIAYYNFLQEFIGDRRIKPSQSAWERSESAFTDVVSVLAPNVIICFSKRNGKRIRSLAGHLPIAVVNHPSSRFRYSEVNPIIAAHIELALKLKAQAPKFTGNDIYYRWYEATAGSLPTPGSHLSDLDKSVLLAERRESMAALDELILQGMGYR
ncbi:hypothetical protein [Enterobacter sp.]|uniref:hypothetical protein n=1 Tax=Enterobacter sp. TaxID=42895 RepID=UPI00296F8486|nr:hypothetical protein [Enterobacter sp.]